MSDKVAIAWTITWLLLGFVFFVMSVVYSWTPSQGELFLGIVGYVVITIGPIIYVVWRGARGY